MTELDALLVLNAIPGLSNLRKKRLIAYYGSAQKVLSLTEKDLFQENRFSVKNVHNFLHFSKDKFLKDEYNLIAAQGIQILTEKDSGYPDLLKNIDDRPIVLYVKGKLPREMKLSIAIVGSRRSSLAGRMIADKFAYALAEKGIPIVSGLARGVDTFAHQGALRAKGETVAVLGSGLACVYPKENHKLFNQISSSAAVISEYPMQTSPLPYNFPRRNRIISGLSLGVIVVEAAFKSGALITADFALEQGREVYAVPCSINSPTAQGVNNLIKQGAKVITEIEDVLEDLIIDIKRYKCSEQKELRCNRIEEFDASEKDSTRKALNEKEQILWESMKDSPVHIDELVNTCGFSSSFTSAVLLQLELKNKIQQLPGKLFRKI